MTQMGFFDLSDRYASLDAKKDPLVEIDAVVPWEEFRPALERVWRKPDADRKSRAGRKPMDAVVMFKALVLSALYQKQRAGGTLPGVGRRAHQSGPRPERLDG